MTLTLTTELIKKYIPNVLIEVDDERPLVEKLIPFFDTAAMQLTAIVGDIDYMTAYHKDILVHACVKKAFANAIPSLDLVITPTGFGVVSTQTIAPASKDRVERLINSLNREAADLLIEFIETCRTYPEWLETEKGRRLTDTFLTLRDAASEYPECVASCGLLIDRFRLMHDMALKLETVIAENYLGYELMSHLLTTRNSKLATQNSQLISLIRVADLSYIKKHIDGDPFRCPDEHEIWHAVQPMIRTVRRDPDLYKLWDETMKEKFEPHPYKNNTPGAFCF